MKTARWMLMVAFLAAASTVAAADPNAAQARPRPPLGNNPHPVIPGGQQPKPVSPAQKPPGRSADQTDRDHSHHGSGRSYYLPGGYYSYADAACGCGPYYVYSYPYAYPPLYVSSEDLYGPRAMLRFMGADNGSQFQPVANITPTMNEDVRVDAPAPKPPADRPINPQATALARRFIKFGDALFIDQKFSEANNRYRKASQSAPQLADTWFRQGFALSAMGRYDQAVAAIQRGLKINPTWAKSGFDLKELYGPDLLAKDAHIDALAQAAVDRPDDANRLFLVGVYLHFDGQVQRAEKFFRRALELAAGDDEHIRAFLK
jgi:tetratricopeptide (TPR) repeat protein